MSNEPRDVSVQFLYLDRETCVRCRAAEAAIEGALAAVRPTLALVGVRVTVDRIHIDTPATAREHDLEVSPTVRVDGRDVQPDVETADCDCVAGRSVPCRVWRYRGRTHDRAPPGLLADAVLRAAYRFDAETRPSDERERGSADAEAESYPVESYFGTESDGGGTNECC